MTTEYCVGIFFLNISVLFYIYAMIWMTRDETLGFFINEDIQRKEEEKRLIIKELWAKMEENADKRDKNLISQAEFEDCWEEFAKQMYINK